MRIVDLFKEEIDRGIPIAALERREINYYPLSKDEVDVVRRVFRVGVEHLRKISPVIASDIEIQESLAIKMAGVAKAVFPVVKSYAFPSVPGSLGVNWIFPQAIKYVATPSATSPAYTSYATNSWDISLTAGTEAFLFGSSTDWYKASPATDAHTFLLIFNNGVIEIGSTPKAEQFRLISEGKQDYGIYTVEPLVEEKVEPNKVLYQYPTPLGALFITHDRGIRWSFLPKVSGTATIKLLGLVFYEHAFASTVKWVA